MPDTAQHSSVAKLKPADHLCFGGKHMVFSGLFLSIFLEYIFVVVFQGVPLKSKQEVPNMQAVAQQTGLAKDLIHTEVCATGPERGKGLTTK